MFNNKTILITGGTGSWGQELTQQLLERFNPQEIRLFSRGEHKQVEMRRKFRNHSKLKFIIGDVRDEKRVFQVSRGVDYIFHLAALKHVPVCEENGWESVLTNVIGTENVINAAIANTVDKVIDVSTDKAVAPFNVYGVSKSLAEKLIINTNNGNVKTKFICVRGGNVIGTNGSVVPLFRQQILKANEITLTNGEMTRFMFTLKHAIELVINACDKAVGGEIFVMDMPAMRILDLAELFIEELGNKDTRINQIGVRPGEKVHEVLISKTEINSVIKEGDYYIILPYNITPEIADRYNDKQRHAFNFDEFSSLNTRRLSKPEIKKMLVEEGWLRKEAPKAEHLERLNKEELLRYFKDEGWLR